jgi:peptide-methionine (R)-S-oxide reductase
MLRNALLITTIFITLISCGQTPPNTKSNYSFKLSENEWKKKLTPQEYYVLREHGTERSFTGELLDNKAFGTYICSACNQKLFSSETKFKSGTGWPSFYDYLSKGIDFGWANEKNEVHCSNCGGHLGHVFKDGPKPTGLRYCINSVSIKFIAK